MQELSLILWISVILQVVAAIMALRLIPITGRALAWILLSAAFVLMASRRVISLVQEEGILQNNWWHAVSAESVALVISFLIVFGVCLIRNIFIQRAKDAEQIRTLSMAVEQNPSSTIIMNTRGLVEYVNPAYCQLNGCREEEVMDQAADIFKPEFTAGNVLHDIWNTLNSGGIWKGEFCRSKRDGVKRWEKACISPVKDKWGDISHYVAVMEDITHQKKQRQELEYMALHDTLTGLPNRLMFNEQLDKAIKIAMHRQESVAVMLMDLNNFKEINDALGHYTGDRVLREIGSRLERAVDAQNMVARMGGDEFLLLIRDASDRKLKQIVADIIVTLKTPFIIDQRKFELGVAIGISIYPDDGHDPDVLLQHADVAMYAAKKSVADFVCYDKVFDESNVSRLELTSELRNAVEHDQFVLQYQPQVNYSSGEVDSIEALLRWRHPLHGDLSPDTFIPLAENTGNIGLITRWVIRNATWQLSQWRKVGIELRLSVNISARDLLDSELPEYINRQMARNGIAADLLTLEITESMLMMYTQQTKEILHALRRIGVRISIDDFGTGYSSLQHLKELPIVELKIDKSFVINMTSNENDAIIVRSTTRLAHNLGMSVVAEGVEDQATLEELEILNCDHAQGYHICRPLALDEFEAWLRRKDDKTNVDMAKQTQNL